MLQATIIAMTVLGCGDQGVKCEAIIGPEKTWQSVEACNSEIPKILRASMDAPYPVITATCDTNVDGFVEDIDIVLTERMNTNTTKTMDGLSVYDVSSESELFEKPNEGERKPNTITRHFKEGYSLVETTASSGLKKLKGLKKRLTPPKRLFVLFKD